MTPNLRIVFSILLLSIASLGCIDLLLDWDDTGVIHTAIEGSAILLCLLLLGLIWRQIERTVRISESDRARTELEFREFKKRNQDTLDQFHAAMHDQFTRWNFSQTEMRVAEGLIRGYSLREIAARANRSVKTVRNQSTVVYGKAGMTGRADLAAFFLSDLMGEDSDE